ncbi:MAG: efflux RND transporter periplasmic adaptor subunit [Bacteroidaceae bacterium]|nr:efflux RND transporter periplasmic adaptor subunit [Bacteroidaceae bacterium]
MIQRNSRMGVAALVAVLMTGAAAVLLMGCGQQQPGTTKAPTRVRTEVVAASCAIGGQMYVGVVEEAEATAVSFTSMGTVRRVLVSEGQAVSRGQLLAEMDDTQAQNMLAVTRAQLAQAEDALARYSQLHERGSMTDAQWVEIQSKVAQARSEVAVAEKNVADCRLVAPVSGIIGRRTVGAGETAMPSQAVVTILDISRVKVKVSVPEAEMAGITATTPTQIHVEAIGRTFEGGTIEKGVQADALTHTYDVRIRVENKERALLPGMVAEVQTLPPTSLSGREQSPLRASVFSLPMTAVQRRADGSLFVWTVGTDTTAHRTAVVLGETVGNRVVIASGLAEGQHVVVEGYQKLSEGTKVAEN